MQRDIPSYENVIDALPCAGQSYATGPARSNGARHPPRRVRPRSSPRGPSRIAPPKDGRTSGNRYETYQVAAATMLLSAVVLTSAVTARNENPAPPVSAHAIVGQVLIEGRGADGVSVAMDGGAPTETRAGGLYRFDGVEVGAHTVTISNYPANTRFGRTSATAIIADDGHGPAIVNFFGSYLRSSPDNRTVTPERRGFGRHSNRLARSAVGGKGEDFPT